MGKDRRFSQVAPDGADWRSPSRRSQNRRDSWTRTEVDTSVKMRYPMYLMHVSDFLRLGELEPHQVLRDAGKVVPWTTGMKHVFFLSHQWTAHKHPDPSLEQLRVMQRLMLRMMSGSVPTTAPTFADASYLPSGAKIEPAEWARLVPDAYVWMDYFSVPQIGEYLATNASDMHDAIASIPAYIERSSHFFAIVPTVRHYDVHGVTCDYGSWLERGWCRLEMWALILARFTNLPVIVVKGGEASHPARACPASSLQRA